MSNKINTDQIILIDIRGDIDRFKNENKITQIFIINYVIIIYFVLYK